MFIFFFTFFQVKRIFYSYYCLTKNGAGPGKVQVQLRERWEAALGLTWQSCPSEAGEARMGLCHTQEAPQGALLRPRGCLRNVQAAEAERQARRWKLGQGVAGSRPERVCLRDVFTVEPTGLAHGRWALADLELYARPA